MIDKTDEKIYAGIIIIVLAAWFMAPTLYVYDNAQNRGTNPAAWGKGTGTLRINKITGTIQKYCYDPAEIEFDTSWWEPIGKAPNQQAKDEIINYFREIQQDQLNKSKKQPLPNMTLEDLEND